MASSEWPITCHVCHKTYSRLDHLQRHLKAHAPSFQYRCPTCKKGFKRSDVLKRHREDCVKSRAKRPPTTRNQACCRCVSQKRRCDSEKPCQNCSKHGAACIYPSNDPHDTWAVAQKGATPKCDKQDLPITCFVLPTFDLDAEPAEFFPFLLEFTKDVSLPYSFENAVAVAGPMVAPDKLQSQHRLDDHFESHLFDLDGWSWDLEALSLPLSTVPAPFFPDSMFGGADWYYPEPLPQIEGTDLQDRAFADKTAEIVTAVGQCMDAAPLDIGPSIGQASLTESSYLDFFSPSRLRRFLDLYWEMWYPNWPTVHRPLFDPLDSSGLLVAAMAIIGACHSVNQEERAASKFWVGAVESWASRELEKVSMRKTKDERRNSIQTIQAACVVCIYQNWNGTPESKRRMRRQFFSAIVGACRDMDMSMAVHRDFRFVSQADFDWKEFIEAEEMIRTFIWVFFIDTAFVIFNRSPPRMPLRQLSMGLACPEKCFQAQSADECFMNIQWWLCKTRTNRKSRPSTLFEFIKTFCKDEIGPSDRDTYAHEAYVNHFAIPSALHVLVFNMSLDIEGPVEQQLQHVRTALRNWKAIWNRRLSIDRTVATSIACFDVSIEPEGEVQGASDRSDRQTASASGSLDSGSSNYNRCTDWRRAGFWRHASEYWLLARLFVERMDSAQRHLQGTGRMADCSSFQSEPRILSRYDEGDMSELHNFLSSCMQIR